MGNFKIEINATGGHGVDRDKKDGEIVNFHEQKYSPDSITKLFIEVLQRLGNAVNSATITHWPGSDHEVLDDFLTGKRTGHF